MLKDKVIFLVFMLSCICAFAADKDTLKAKPFIYNEDFEGAVDPVRFVSERGKNTVNFKGITDEKAFSGKKSYKLDVTLGVGGSYSLEIPLNDIPVAGNMKFSGMIRVEECSPRSRCVLGMDFKYLPCMPEASGARSFPWNGKFDEWTCIYADVPDRSHALASKSFPYQFWNVDADDTAIYVPRIFINLFTRDGEEFNRRLVVYIDDLKIEGGPVDKEEFRKDAEKRWEIVKARTNRKIDGWESILANAERELSSMSGLSGEAARLKAELEKQMKENDVRKLPAIQNARRNGWMTADNYQQLEAFFNNLQNRYVVNIRELARQQAAQRKYIAYAVDTAVTPADWVLPDTVLIPGRITDEISITACPGEYEPASFVVHGISDVKGLKVMADGLKGSAGTIGPDAVDIRVLKCWYQDAVGGGKRVLTPELLLKDENLVMLDHQKKLSRIKFKLPQGDKYLCAADPEYPKLVPRNEPLAADYPTWVANDAEILQPVELSANENKQFWITVHVPEDAKPGEYSGRIMLSSDNSVLGEMALRLRVLPFRLSQPNCEVSVWNSDTFKGIGSLYYQGRLFPSGYAMIEKRYRAELENQLAHGVNAPMTGIDDGSETDFLGPMFNREMLERTLRIRNELGVPDDFFMGNGHVIHRGLGIVSHKAATSIEISRSEREVFQKGISEYLGITKSYGMKNVYFWLADERDGKQLEAWLPVFRLIHEVGAKVTTCMQIGNTFETVGGITDIFLCENGISKRETDKWHTKGTKVWPIWNPNGGQENSDLTRRNHGFLIWKTNCDGMMETLYSQETAWNEAATDKLGVGGDGAHSMAYRTTDGIIDTFQWEGFREGVDDIRYVRTLLKLIAQAKAEGKKSAEAAEAEKYLESADTKYGNLDKIRSEIIGHMLKLL